MVETGEAADDIVGTPGGIAYRGNIHELGKENPWPYIKSTSVTLSNWFNEINVRYRDHIETGAGETRNNIFGVSRRQGGLHGKILKLYAVHIPPGIELTQYMSGGMLGTLGAVLIIKVAPEVAPGQYAFEIGLEISGWDYGTVPCTVEVIE
jgi:hypothetical protein